MEPVSKAVRQAVRKAVACESCNPVGRDVSSVGAIEFQAQPETIKLRRDMNHVSWAIHYAAFNVSEFKRREIQDRIEIVR